MDAARKSDIQAQERYSHEVYGRDDDKLERLRDAYAALDALNDAAIAAVQSVEKLEDIPATGGTYKLRGVTVPYTIDDRLHEFINGPLDDWKALVQAEIWRME